MATPKLYKTTAAASVPRPRVWLLPAAAVAVVLLFLVAPWSFEHKAHAALHGLCAQRPSHSFGLGGRTLPFDARMTGIYGGFLATALYLLLRGRHRAFRPPSAAVLASLGLPVAALAVDGTNALLVDLGLRHLYAPDNRLRLATGLGTGIALAVIMCFVLATTLWRSGRWTQRVVNGVGELPLLVAVQAPLSLAILSGAGWLYVPVSLLLLASASIVVASLVLVPLVLTQHGDRPFATAGQLRGPAIVALLLAWVVMVAFAGGRFLFEHVTGAPPLT